MIELTVAQLTNAIPIFQQLVKIKLPARLAFRVTKAAQEMDEQYKTIQKIREDFAQRYFIPDGKGNYKTNEDNTMFLVQEGKEKEYLKEVNDFMNDKITLNCEKIPEDVLDKLPEMSSAELAVIMPLFE